MDVDGLQFLGYRWATLDEHVLSYFSNQYRQQHTGMLTLGSHCPLTCVHKALAHGQVRFKSTRGPLGKEGLGGACIQDYVQSHLSMFCVGYFFSVNYGGVAPSREISKAVSLHFSIPEFRKGLAHSQRCHRCHLNTST